MCPTFRSFTAHIYFSDEQYGDFLRTVRSFERTLVAFKEIFDRGTLPNLSQGDPQQWKKRVDRERREIVGDFEGTLSQCQNLLEKNAARQDWPNFVKGAAWVIGGNQDEARSLKERLQFHAIKVSTFRRLLFDEF